jgi:hypothetical protein
MKRAGILLILMFIANVGEVFSQVTITYEAVVHSALGPHSAEFPAGQRVMIAYTLDPSSVDVNADPMRGTFLNAVLSATVSFPGLGVFANAGPNGTVQTINDGVFPSGAMTDQVFFDGGPISSASTLGGESISSMVVEFFDFVEPPSMIASDALPLFRLDADQSFILFRTSSGNTFVRFAEPVPVTLHYDGFITSASGPHAALFPAGEQVAVTYTLAGEWADSNPDPHRGLFHNAVQNLSVSFPGLSIAADAGPSGLAQTFDNVASSSGSLSDQVFFHGGPISSASPLAGEPMTRIEVDFLSRFVTPPAEPTMLSSDALPRSRLPLTDAFVLLYTDSGPTFVHFAPPPRLRIILLIHEVEALADTGALTARQADGLIRKLEDAINRLDRGRTDSACNQLQSFIDKVNDLVAAGRLSADQGQGLIETARSIQQQLGC